MFNINWLIFFIYNWNKPGTTHPNPTPSYSQIAISLCFSDSPYFRFPLRREVVVWRLYSGIRQREYYCVILLSLRNRGWFVGISIEVERYYDVLSGEEEKCKDYCWYCSLCVAVESEVTGCELWKLFVSNRSCVLLCFDLMVSDEA